MRVSREISLGSSLHRASTDALIVIYDISQSLLTQCLSYYVGCNDVQ